MSLKLILIAVHVILGAVLIGLSMAITEQSKNAQLSSDLARANQGLYTIGVILVTLGVAVGALSDEKSIETHGDSIRKVLVGLIGVLGLVILVLAAILVNKTSGQARNSAIGALVVGITLLLFGGGVLAYHHKDLLSSLGFSDMDSSSGMNSSSSDDSGLAFRCY